jgi:phage replication O-like protein O
MGIQQPNFTQYPNVLLDSLKDFTHAEHKVVSCFVRETFGWHRPTAVLSLSRIAELTGIHKDTAVEVVKVLVERGILVKEGRKAGGNEYRLVVCLTDSPTAFDGLSDTSKEKKINNTEPKGSDGTSPVLSLRERVLNALYEARSPSPSSPNGKEGGNSFQQRALTIVNALWKQLWGERFLPDYGALAKLVSAYGGYSNSGPERLCMAMLNSAGRDVPGGPLNILFTEAKRQQKTAQVAPVMELPDRTGTADAARELLSQPREDGDIDWDKLEGGR